MTILLCIFGGLLAVCGDVLFKRWALRNAGAFAVAGLVIYALDACVWAYIIRRGVDLSTGSIAWAATGIILSFLAGVVLYHEHPSGLQYLGAGLVFIGLLLVSLA